MQLRQIEEKNLELESLSKAKTDILGIVAHDLQGPFNNIEMMAKLLQKKTMPEDQEIRMHEMILKCCQSSKTIINDLLEMARYEQKENFDFEPHDLNQVLEEIEEDWQLQLKETRQLSVQKAGAALLIQLDKYKFKRVLDNLISNAVKFTQDKGRIDIFLQKNEQEVLLKISDNGVGIPQDMRQHLFKPFSRAGRSGVRGERSVGLGLSITRTLVEQHGGTIDVDTEQQQGTTFCITLPIHT
ncbi:hypothetical protein GCM10028895_13560 [Pontibacter rugosus]